jgi:hypothetical protein
MNMVIYLFARPPDAMRDCLVRQGICVSLDVDFRMVREGFVRGSP